MSKPRTISMTMPDGREVISDMPPAYVMGAVKRVTDAIAAGREPDTEDSDVAWRWARAQDQKYPLPPAPKQEPDGTTYPLLPLDMDRLLQPGTLSQLLQLEDTDPAEALMCEMPLEDFITSRESLAEVVRELGRSLVVILLVDEEGAGAA